VCSFRSQNSSVGIETGYGRDCRISIRGRGKNFLFSVASKPSLEPTQSPIQWLPGVKRPWREADHSPPTTAEVTKMLIFTSAPPYVFITKCLINYAHGQIYPFLNFYSVFSGTDISDFCHQSYSCTSTGELYLPFWVPANSTDIFRSTQERVLKYQFTI
jgi:hypothetical protein